VQTTCEARYSSFVIGNAERHPSWEVWVLGRGGRVYGAATAAGHTAAVRHYTPPAGARSSASAASRSNVVTVGSRSTQHLGGAVIGDVEAVAVEEIGDGYRVGGMAHGRQLQVGRIEPWYHALWRTDPGSGRMRG
jgi:hypothetical protein